MDEFELSPEMREVLRRASETAVGTQRIANQLVATIKPALDAWQQSFAATIAPALEKWSLQLPAIVESVTAQYGPLLARVGETMREMWRRVLPPNWVELTTDQVLDVVERVRVTGFTLVWLPRTEIVVQVLGVEPAETASVLLARRVDVLDDARRCLADVTDGDLILIRAAIEKAIDALAAGHDWAAQALASSAFTSEIHQWFEMGTKAIRKRMAEEDPMEAGIEELRLRTIFLAGTRALADYRPDRAWPPRTEFNRHNTAHRITKEQWTEANALCAVMLSTALLREIDYWYGVLRSADD